MTISHNKSVATAFRKGNSWQRGRLNLKTALSIKTALSVIMLVMGGSFSVSASEFGSEIAAWRATHFSARDAVLVERDDGTLLVSQNADAPMVPASTLKIFTALLALDNWGDDYHWPTRFEIDGSVLTVIGNGDPFLVSQELLKVAQGLVPLIKQPITQIVVDGSQFVNEPVPGRSLVNDPYNAPMSAVAANFNTVQLRRTSLGFESGEEQTPLTAIAMELAPRVAAQESWPIGATKRVNLVTVQNAHRQFAELLIQFMQQVEPSAVASNVSISYPVAMPLNAKLKSLTGSSDAVALTEYVHINSKPLKEVLVGTLKYSNNFIANQLFLSLGNSTPKSFAATTHWLKAKLQTQFAWRNYSLVDGSGLSADNRLSAAQMSDILLRFSPHFELLPITEYPDLKAKVFAKTGTLNNVRTLAGYILIGDKRYRFSYFFNRAVAWKHRESSLDALVKVLAQSPV